MGFQYDRNIRNSSKQVGIEIDPNWDKEQWYSATKTGTLLIFFFAYDSSWSHSTWTKMNKISHARSIWYLEYENLIYLKDFFQVDYNFLTCLFSIFFFFIFIYIFLLLHQELSKPIHMYMHKNVFWNIIRFNISKSFYEITENCNLIIKIFVRKAWKGERLIVK